MSQNTRLAFVITELEVGGAERCLVNLATRINREKFQPVVYSLARRPPAGKDQLVRQLEEAQVPVRFLDLQSAWQIFSAVSRLARLLRDEQPQIVQTFLFHANVVGTLAARRAGVPQVATGVRVADPRRWRAWVERWACGGVDRIVCVSKSVAEHCRTFARFPAEALTTIPNGVDAAEFASARPIDLAKIGVPPGRKAIVYIGRLDAQKGLDELLFVTPHLFQQLPDHDLVLVGDGPQRLMLQSTTKSLHLDQRVHFAGWREDVPAILAAAEMLVLPSRWEGMPNVVLEAMAAGKPVVARRVEGIEELLGNLGKEQIVDIGPKELVADRIIQLAQNPHLAVELGRLNQQRANEHFSIDAMVEKYERLYESLIDVKK
jgi:glycosyltransferase involved in cell wall biosynthesis